MSCIYTLEPLSNSILDYLVEQTKEKVETIDRDNLLTYPDKYFEYIEILICRDRDNLEYIIDKSPNLKFIFIVSVGVEKLPFGKLIGKDIAVANTGGVNSQIMSQYVMGYILYESVRILENADNQKKHLWKRFQCVDSLEGRNILIVGAGHSGRMIAQKANMFGMNCIGVKKHPCKLDFFKEIISLEEMNEYLPWADYVVCTIPTTQETRDLFNYNRFSMMKESSMFINISRSPIVVMEDLVKALRHKIIKTAVLDVFDNEPLDDKSNLWDIPNLYITPHSSGRLENFMSKAIECFVLNYNAFLAGTFIPNKIKIENGY